MGLSDAQLVEEICKQEREYLRYIHALAVSADNQSDDNEVVRRAAKEVGQWEWRVRWAQVWEMKEIRTRTGSTQSSDYYCCALQHVPSRRRLSTEWLGEMTAEPVPSSFSATPLVFSNRLKPASKIQERSDCIIS